MKRKILVTGVLLALSVSTLFAVPPSAGKLAGTETAYIDTSFANLGLMDSTFNLFEIVSVKTNFLFDAAGLYNIGVKAGYRFKNLMDIRIAVGYTWFSLNEDQFVTSAADTAASDSGITVNSLDLNIEGSKMYAAVMVPVFGFNVNANFGYCSSVDTDPFTKATVGIEKTLFAGRLSLFANGGMYFNLPESEASEAEQEVYYNTLESDFYMDGGVRAYFGDHFNIELGFIYPGVDMPLGTDSETGEDQELNMPVFPVFNIAYRL